MLMRFGAALNSGWCQEAFTPETVLKICSCAFSKLKIIASPSVVAGRMNDAAGHLLLALDAEASPKEGKEWADELARSAIAFRNACGGGRPMRKATSSSALMPTSCGRCCKPSLRCREPLCALRPLRLREHELGAQPGVRLGRGSVIWRRYLSSPIDGQLAQSPPMRGSAVAQRRASSQKLPRIC